MIYSIDRIEGEKAVLIADDGTQRIIQVNELPKEAKETDCLYYRNGCYLIDEEETKWRKQKIEELQNRLFINKEE